MLIGAVGDDIYSHQILKGLKEVNVIPLFEIIKGHNSSRCGVGIFKKERCLVSDVKASGLLSYDFVRANLDEILNADLAMIEGYFIRSKYEIVKYVVEQFNKKNKKVAFTLSATFLLESFYERMLEIANKSDFVFCNFEEALALAKLDCKDIHEVANKIHMLLEPRDRILVITNGSHATSISRYDYSKNIMDYEIKKFVPKIPSEKIVDTNGCGDCKKIFYIINSSICRRFFITIYTRKIFN